MTFEFFIIPVIWDNAAYFWKKRFESSLRSASTNTMNFKFSGAKHAPVENYEVESHFDSKMKRSRDEGCRWRRSNWGLSDGLGLQAIWDLTWIRQILCIHLLNKGIPKVIPSESQYYSYIQEYGARSLQSSLGAEGLHRLPRKSYSLIIS